MLMVNHLIGFGVGRGGAVNITFTASAVDATDLTTYSFAGQAIGAAATDRIVLVGVVGRATANGRDVSSLSIGGSAATRLVNVTADDGGNSRVAEIWGLLVPSGTTATIAPTFNGGMVRAAIGVWAMTGTGGATTVSGSNTASTTNPTATTITIPANGGAIGMLYSTDTSGRVWSGTAGLVEDFDSDLEGQVSTGAHVNSVAGSVGGSVSIDTTAAQNPALAVASWAPA